MSTGAIAVIGLGCRFPGSSNTATQYFDNLLGCKDCITSTPKNRWNLDFYQDDEKSTAGKLVPKRGGYMDDLYDFDNEAFNMSAKEAMNIDPQQRVLLEVTHQALEDANIDFRGSNTGVFIGTGASDFTQMATTNPYYVNEYTATGGSMAIHSNRLSFSFDLRGPSMSIDSACSASGSALHVALRCLENGDCEQAIVGGINMLQNVSMTIAFSKLGVLSPDCTCKSFDTAANGYVRSEGCGVVVLKPLEAAIRDGNNIYMTILGVKCNEDGSQSPSLTMPSGEAQELLIRKTLQHYKINPNDIFYVEAHATGTPVGDPIEANAIGRVLGGSGITRAAPLKLGSVKTNIGHLEFASAMASLIKCAMMMKTRTLVPTIHYKEPNPKIEFEKYNMTVQVQQESFVPASDKLMMISSFGFGGANACVVLGPPPAAAQAAPKAASWKLESKPYIYLTSALSKNAINARIQQVKSIQNNDEFSIMSSLNNKVHVTSKYLSYGFGESVATAKFVEPIKVATQRTPVVFVFSGQGPQNIAMGRELYKTFPKFKEVIDECDALYQKYGNISVINDMGLFGPKVGDKNAVHKIEVTLPGLIFMQIGLYELWKSFGVIPDAIVGHSFGEMCAIYASNACSLKDIICVTIARAELMKKITGQGTMLAVGCSEQEIMKMIEAANLPQIWIAAANSPVSVTVGGIHESIKKLSEMCTEKRIFNRQLNVTNAFHTPLMAPLRDQAQATFKEISAQTALPSVKFISTVTGDFWDTTFDYTYFWKNIENVVLFQAAVQTALKKFGEDTLFVEMAPHPVLSSSIKQSGAQQVLYSQHREENQQISLLQAAAKMVSYGIPVNWSSVIGKSEQSIVVPDYPYQRKTFLYESEHYREMRLPSQYGSLLGGKIIHHETTFQNFISTKTYDWLKDHVVQQSVIFPAAGYIELILEAVGEHATQVSIKNPLLVPSDSFTCVQTSIKNNRVEIFSKREGDNSWTLHAVGDKEKQAQAPKSVQVDLKAIQDRCNTNTLPKEEVYKRFNVMNLDYGHDFQCLDMLYQGDEESLGVLSTKHLRDKQKFIIHPAILDCCFQSFLGALQSSAYTYLPTGMKHIDVLGKTSDDLLYAYCNLSHITEKDITGDIQVCNAAGEVVVQVQGFTCTKVANRIISYNHFYSTVWQEKRLPQQDLKWTCDLSSEIATWNNIIANKQKFYRAIAHYISKLPESINTVDLPLNAKRHLAWCKSFCAQQGPIPDDFDAEKELAGLVGFDKEKETILRVGKHLEDLITNRDNAVSRIMFGDDLIASVYQSSVTFKPAVDIFVSMFEKLKIEPNRVIRILEVGAGTGTMAKRIFPLLQQYNARVEYYFTDVSASFMMQDKRFKEYSFVQYKVVDISKPLTSQGIEESSLDMVIGFDVVHTSYNLSIAMNNLAKALVPDGLLFMIEPTVMEPHMHFIFGVFREWWHFEDNRTTCCLTVDQWKELVPQFGFKNLTTFELVPGHVHSIILAQKAEATAVVDAAAVKPVIYNSGDVMPLLELVQQKVQAKDNSPLIIVTEDAQIECKNPSQSSLVGFARVIANENQNWLVRAVDFAASETPESKQKWIDHITANITSFETECAIRNGQVLVPRLKLVPIEASVSAKVDTTKPYRLEIGDGLLDNLKYHYCPLDIAPRGQVLIKTKAAALNFKDVMLAMNMLDIANKCLGIEFSGVVEQVGENSKFKVGDEVYGIADFSLASHIVANEELIVKKPANISFAQAASIPIVFLTTYYALINKANMQPEQTLLVHSAAGGVGQAAIQIAKWKGVDVIATVSSTGTKREFLRKEYGVEKFSDSHTTTWDADVMKFAPEGVDIVLNSLAGANIEKGIKCLKPGGNFIEIGKRDILDNNPIHMRPFLNNLSYFAVHLDLLLETHTKVIGKLLRDVTALFEQGILKPFVDREFPARNTIEAFKYMQSGKHMGKIMVSYETGNEPAEVLPALSLFSSSKTYILSGGLGALGFEIAKWMVAKGARYIVLLSRNAAKLNKEHKRGLAELEAKGARIHVSTTNVVNAADVEKCYASLSTVKFPLVIGGVMHLAMVLDDDSISKQNAARFNKVMEPKIKGAQNLVNVFCKNKNTLEFILFFSSISSVIGNPEQSNYASANAFLDSYAQSLQQAGFNAKTLNLGAVDDVGICATDYKLRKIMAARGLENSLTVAQVTEYIRTTLETTYTQCVTPFNVKGICDFNTSLRARMSNLIRHEQEDGNGADSGDDTAQSIAKKIEKILQLDTAIDINEKLTVYGVDSLLAVEISSMLSKSFGLKVSQMDILSGITVANLQAMTEAQ